MTLGRPCVSHPLFVGKLGGKSSLDLLCFSPWKIINSLPKAFGIRAVKLPKSLNFHLKGLHHFASRLFGPVRTNPARNVEVLRDPVRLAFGRPLQ